MADGCDNPNEGTYNVVQFVSDVPFPANATLRHVCNHGFVESRGEFVRMCLGKNTWTGMPPGCSRYTNPYVVFGLTTATLVILLVFISDFFYRVRRRRKRLHSLHRDQHRIASFSLTMTRSHPQLSQQPPGGITNFGFISERNEQESDSGNEGFSEVPVRTNTHAPAKRKRKSKKTKRVSANTKVHADSECGQNALRSLPPLKTSGHVIKHSPPVYTHGEHVSPTLDYSVEGYSLNPSQLVHNY